MLCSAITAVTLSSINFFQDLLKQEQESLGMCVLVFSCTYPQKKFSLTDRSWETERIVARLPPHAKIFLCLKWRFIYIIQFAKAIWSHGGHIWLFWPLFGSKNELSSESPFQLPKRAILSEMQKEITYQKFSLRTSSGVELQSYQISLSK